MDKIDMEADAPGELDLCSNGDLQAAEAAHTRGDKTASIKACIYCLEKGIVPPAWAEGSVRDILEKQLNNIRTKKTHNSHVALTARAAALSAVEDHLGFGYSYDITPAAVAELAIKLFSRPSVIKALKKRGVASPINMDDMAGIDDVSGGTASERLSKWWYGKHGKNRRKYIEPDYDLLGIFYEELGM